MNESVFYYSKSSTKKAVLWFLLIGLFGLAFAYWQFFVPSDKIYLIRRVGSIFLSLVGLGGFLYLMFKPVKEHEPALIISEKGISGNTSAPAKAAGLVEWDDIEDIGIGAQGMTVFLKNPEKYRARMNTFMAKEGFKTAQQALIYSLMGVGASRQDIESALGKYRP